jgi:hypothetical protein
LLLRGTSDRYLLTALAQNEANSKISGKLSIVINAFTPS